MSTKWTGLPLIYRYEMYSHIHNVYTNLSNGFTLGNNSILNYMMLLTGAGWVHVVTLLHYPLTVHSFYCWNLYRWHYRAWMSVFNAEKSPCLPWGASPEQLRVSSTCPELCIITTDFTYILLGLVTRRQIKIPDIIHALTPLPPTTTTQKGKTRTNSKRQICPTRNPNVWVIPIQGAMLITSSTEVNTLQWQEWRFGWNICMAVIQNHDIRVSLVLYSVTTPRRNLLNA